MRWDILKIPNPGKWEKIDYFCLGLVWSIVLARICIGMPADIATGVPLILQVLIIFPFLQMFSICTITCFFDRWLVKSTNDDHGNEWTHAQGTMTFTTEEQMRNNGGPDRNIYNVTRSYIVHVLVDIDSNGDSNGDGDDKEEDRSEISSESQQQRMTIPQSTEQRYQRTDEYNGFLPTWMKSAGLDENNPNVVARFPVRVLKRDPSFAAVYSSAASIHGSSQVLFPDHLTWFWVAFYCSLSVAFATAVGLGFAYSPLPPIEIFFINAWMIVQLIWGCSLGLASHVNGSDVYGSKYTLSA